MKIEIESKSGAKAIITSSPEYGRWVTRAEAPKFGFKDEIRRSIEDCQGQRVLSLGEVRDGGKWKYLRLGINPETEAALQEYFDQVGQAERELVAHWLTINLGACWGECHHDISGRDDEPRSAWYARAEKSLSGCIKSEMLSQIARERVDGEFARREAKNQGAAEERARVETIEKLARKTGEKQKLFGYLGECDGSAAECSSDHITVYVLPTGEREINRTHTF